MKKGLFISVEGIDGAGKSTHVKFIQNYLESHGQKVIITREPGGTATGEKIRDLLLHGDHLHSNTELLLYFASRQEIIQKVILPALNNGTCVIADRFVDASIAYQGGGRGLGVNKVKQVYSMIEPQLKTDITFLFDAPLDLAMARLQRERHMDRIERESVDFFRIVQKTYHDIAAEDPERVKIISTKPEISITRTQLTKYLDNLLSQQV